MKASSFGLGLSLAAAGVFTPFGALAQGAAPAAPAAAPAPAPAPAPAAAPAAPAAAVVAPEPTPSPATEPAPLSPKEVTPPGVAPETAAAAAPAEAAPVAEAPPPLATITGYVDAAYHMELANNSVSKPALARAYDGPGGFMLHAAHLGVGHSFSPEASAFVSLDFGSDAGVNNANYSGGIPVDVREGYAKWTPGDFTFVAGKFVTMNGIEVVDGPLDPTITRGFLFWLAEPVGHTGAKAQYALADGMAHVGLGLVNGWDRLADNNNQKTLLFNADIIPNTMFHAQLSGSYGAEQTANPATPGNEKDKRLTVDLTGGVVLDSLTLNFQGLVGSEPKVGAGGQDDSWFGFGIQPVFVMDKFSLGGRIEYFSNKHGSRVGIPVTIPPVAPATVATTGTGPVDGVGLLNFTITPGFTPTKNFMFRAEYRIDAALAAKDATGASDKNVFYGKSTQNTIAIGATYIF